MALVGESLFEQSLRALSPDERALILGQVDEQLERSTLLGFGGRVYRRFQTPRHVRFLAEKLEAAERGQKRRLAISLAPGHGKLVADDVPVATVDGWKAHGDLQVGDWVYGLDGKPTPVLATSAPDFATLEVELSDGSRIAVHPRHEWTVYRWGLDSETLETAELFRQVGEGVPRGRGNRNKFSLPLWCGVDGEETDLPIDPYVMGAWLGDGSSTKACLTHAIGETEVVAAIAAAGYERTSTCSVNAGTTGATYFRGGLHTALKTAGVYGNKHIPAVYLRASREQRLELLAGLIDTDGHVTHNERSGDFVRIVCGDERLTADICELVCSLGWRSSVHVAQPCTSTSGIVGRKPVNTIKFVPDSNIPTRLERKRIHSTRITSRKIGIVAVREIDPRPGKCIQVGAADGLYLVGRTMQPTHNSTLLQIFLAWFLGKDPERRMLALSASEALAFRNSRYVREIVKSDKWPWPEIALKGESLEEWYTTAGGGVRAIGKGGTVTGFRAEGILCDDIQKDAGTETSRQQDEEWFREVLTTRLEPGGFVVIIQCMTGDTAVTMADGSHARLDAVRPGDRVLAWKNGELVERAVLNWTPQGEDDVFEIRTGHSRVRANARHPFLVERDGAYEWVRVADLKCGARLVTSLPSAKPGCSAGASFRTSVIRSIKPAGREMVYDIQVDDAECFLADGLVSHNTRWHDDDIIGRLEKGESADQWEFINIPVIAGESDALGRLPGEVLWPERWSRADIEALRLELGLAGFSAQYMGDPVPRGGATFKEEWFGQRYEVAPSLPIVALVVDSAWKDGPRNDFSVLATWGTDKINFYLLDVVRGKWEFPELQRRVVETYHANDCNALIVEDKQSGTAIIQQLRTNTGLPVIGVTPTVDKESRAEGVTPYFEAGRVHLPVSAPWLPVWLHEHLRFPAGKDDQVDTTSMGISWLNTRIVTKPTNNKRYRGFMAR